MAIRRSSRFLLTTALVATLGGALGFTLLVAWLRSDDFQRRATRAIEAAVEGRTGEALTLGSVRVELWPPAAVVEGFHLFDAVTGDTIASAERIRAPVVVRDGGLRLGTLTVQHPVVQLHLEDGKLREFSRMKRGKPLERLPWAALDVEEATIRLFVDAEGEIELSRVDITPTDGPISDVTGKLRVRARNLEQTAQIDWDGVVIGPDRLEVPALLVQTDVLTLEGRVAYALQGDLDARVKGSARLEELQPLFSPPTALLGHVEFDVAASGPPKEAVVEIALLGDDLGFDKAGRNWPLIQHRFGDLSASLEVSKDGVDIEKAVFVWGEGRLTAWGHITPDKVLEDGHILAEDLSLAHVFRQLDAFDTPWVDLQLDADVEIAGTLDPLVLGGAMDFGLADLHVTDRPIDDPAAYTMLRIPHGSITGRWSFEDDAVVLDADEVTTPLSRGRALASISTKSGPIDVTAELWQADLRDLRPLGASDLHGQGVLSMHFWGEKGKFQLTGEGDVRDFAVTGLPYADRLVTTFRSPDLKRLYFDDAKGLKGTTDYTGDLMLDFRPPMSMDLSLAIPGGRIEDVVGVFIDLPGLTGGMGGTLWLRGPLYDMDGEAHLALTDANLWGETFSTGEGHGYMDRGLFTLDDLRVTRGDGTEGLVLRGGIDREWRLNMELVGDGLALERLDHLSGMELPVSGRVSVLARIDNTLFDPAPHGRLAVTDVRYAGSPVEDSVVRFFTDGGVTRYRGTLVGETVALDGTLGLWGDQPYALSAEFRDFPAHLVWPTAANGEPIEAVLSGELQLGGHFGDDPSPVDIVADAQQVTVRWSGQELVNQGSWHYEQHGRAFELERFEIVGGATRFALSASGGDEPLQVDGEGQIDLDLLRMVVPGLERAEGVANVSVEASGRPPDVAAVVEVRLEEGEVPLVRHSSFPGTFEDVTASIRGTEDGYELLSAHASLGGGEAKAWGRIDAEGWVPKRYDLRTSVTDAQVQWVDYLPPAIGDAEISFDGPSRELLLSGDVSIDDMTFSDRIDWEDWVVEWQDELLVEFASIEEDPWFALDVAIRADDTIRLRNNIAEGTATADLRVVGDTSRPGLVGTIEVHDALAYLQDREFVVERGEIAFRDPWTWDPDLDFDLVTDIHSRDRSYRVNYLVLGPFSDWRTETRSEPALPQSDINALLWFGMTAEELEEMGELSQAIGQGVADLVLADFFVTNQTAQDLRGELPALFDRIDLVTGVNARGEYSPDPRLLVEKRIEDAGGLDVTAEIDLARTSDQYYRVDVPLSDSWSLAGWYATRQRDRNLPIGGAYGVDLSARWEAE